MSKNDQKRAKRTTILTPILETSTVDLAEEGGPSLFFRKKILPEGSISYPDETAPGGRRKVSFTRDYNQGLVDAFRAKAIECPTVQLADEHNGHNMDIKRTAGEIHDLDLARPDDVDGPGLYAVIRARDEENARLLRDLPRLGVSAQIKERFERVDGKKFPAAVRHILVTADPRVVGMGPWRPVSLSSNDDDGPVIDLSDAEYEETSMTSFQTNDGEISLSDDEIEAALEAAMGGSGGGMQLSTTTGRSQADGTVMDLAARLDASETTTAGVLAKLAASDWAKDRLSLSNAGVPKTLLDEAERVLKHAGENVLSLSDEDGRQVAVDARAVIRAMLEKARGMVDLSGVEGSDHDLPINLANGAGEQAVTPEQLAAWRNSAGF